MKRLILFAIAMTLAIFGTLVFMSANRAELIPYDYARVIGTGCFMFSGLFWMLYGMTYRTLRNEVNEGK